MVEALTLLPKVRVVSSPEVAVDVVVVLRTLAVPELVLLGTADQTLSSPASGLVKEVVRVTPHWLLVSRLLEAGVPPTGFSLEVAELQSVSVVSFRQLSRGLLVLRDRL
jgi:hypothetical protein